MISRECMINCGFFSSQYCSMNTVGPSTHNGLVTQPLKANLSIPQLLVNSSHKTQGRQSGFKTIKVGYRLPPLSTTRTGKPNKTVKLGQSIEHIQKSLESMQAELEDGRQSFIQQKYNSHELINRTQHELRSRVRQLHSLKVNIEYHNSVRTSQLKQECSLIQERNQYMKGHLQQLQMRLKSVQSVIGL